MKYTLGFLAVIFFCSSADCQIKKASKFKFSVSKGITYNFDGKIFLENKPLDVNVSQYNVDLTNFEIGYFISNNHEVGLSVGSNSFTKPESNFKTLYYIENTGDTIYQYSSGYKYVKLTWISIYYNFHFLDEFHAGIKFGEVSPTFEEYYYYNYFSFMIGKYYKVTDNFLADVGLNLSSASKLTQLKFNSWQLSLYLGVNLLI